MRLVLLAAVLTLGCAIGGATLNPDGSCEVHGVALGRAEIVAYYANGQSTMSEDPNTETRAETNVCARIGGGTGSAAWWAAAGAAFGALIAALPALL
jgi:hypothetical protein